MKVERATLKDIFYYLFDVGVRKLLLEKEKKYLHELFEKWDPKHLQLDEDFDDLKTLLTINVCRFLIWMTGLVSIKDSEKVVAPLLYYFVKC